MKNNSKMIQKLFKNDSKLTLFSFPSFSFESLVACLCLSASENHCDPDFHPSHLPPPPFLPPSPSCSHLFFFFFFFYFFFILLWPTWLFPSTTECVPNHHICHCPATPTCHVLARTGTHNNNFCQH